MYLLFLVYLFCIKKIFIVVLLCYQSKFNIKLYKESNWFHINTEKYFVFLSHEN